MQTKEYIGFVEKLLEQISDGTLPYNHSIANQILSSSKTIYTNYTNSLISDTIFKNYSHLISADYQKDYFIFKLILENLLILSHFDETISNRNNSFHAVRCELSYLKNMINNNKLINSNNYKGKTLTTFPIKKGCVYTVITGGYDMVQKPQCVNPYLDYILFTDSPESVTSNIWKVKKLNKTGQLDSHLLSRFAKILPYDYLSEYDYSIYIDGNFEITGDLIEMIQKYHVRSSMLCLNHIQSDCIYEEAIACKNMKKDSSSAIDSQIRLFIEDDYPEHNGLINGCMLVRFHDDELQQRTMKDWWNIVSTGSQRDQLSFNYVAWKNHFMYDSFPFPYYNNPYIKMHSHSSK